MPVFDLMFLAQAMIIMCGITTAMMTTHMEYRVRRLAAPFGLLSQPFWFYSAWITDSWGMVGLCFLYGGRWLYVARRDLRIYMNERKTDGA